MEFKKKLKWVDRVAMILLLLSILLYIYSGYQAKDVEARFESSSFPFQLHSHIEGGYEGNHSCYLGESLIGEKDIPISASKIPDGYVVNSSLPSMRIHFQALYSDANSSILWAKQDVYLLSNEEYSKYLNGTPSVKLMSWYNVSDVTANVNLTASGTYDAPLHIVLKNTKNYTTYIQYSIYYTDTEAYAAEQNMMSIRASWQTAGDVCIVGIGISISTFVITYFLEIWDDKREKESQ